MGGRTDALRLEMSNSDRGRIRRTYREFREMRSVIIDCATAAASNAPRMGNARFSELCSEGQFQNPIHIRTAPKAIETFTYDVCFLTTPKLTYGNLKICKMESFVDLN